MACEIPRLRKKDDKISLLIMLCYGTQANLTNLYELKGKM